MLVGYKHSRCKYWKGLNRYVLRKEREKLCRICVMCRSVTLNVCNETEALASITEYQQTLHHSVMFNKTTGESCQSYIMSQSKEAFNCIFCAKRLQVTVISSHLWPHSRTLHPIILQMTHNILNTLPHFERARINFQCLQYRTIDSIIERNKRPYWQTSSRWWSCRTTIRPEISPTTHAHQCGHLRYWTASTTARILSCDYAKGPVV